jgi:hypothetical protein
MWGGSGVIRTLASSLTAAVGRFMLVSGRPGLCDDVSFLRSFDF